MPSFVMESFANVDGLGFQRLRCAVLTSRGLLLGPGVRLTTRYHGYIVSDKSDEGQHTSLLVEMGNPTQLEPLVNIAVAGALFA